MAAWFDSRMPEAADIAVPVDAVKTNRSHATSINVIGNDDVDLSRTSPVESRREPPSHLEHRPRVAGQPRRVVRRLRLQGFAPYFESQFFDESEKNSTVYVYAIFAITFVMRPIGSWIFGRFADCSGHRAALTVSVSLMAACSMLIAVVPSQHSIGSAKC